MDTVEQTVSTWGADVVRGLAHPDSAAARQARIAVAREAQLQRALNLDAALQIIRSTVNNAVDAFDVLGAMTESLTRDKRQYDSDLVRRLDELADYLKYGEEA